MLTIEWRCFTYTVVPMLQWIQACFVVPVLVEQNSPLQKPGSTFLAHVNAGPCRAQKSLQGCPLFLVTLAKDVVGLVGISWICLFGSR